MTDTPIRAKAREAAEELRKLERAALKGEQELLHLVYEKTKGGQHAGSPRSYILEDVRRDMRKLASSLDALLREAGETPQWCAVCKDVHPPSEPHVGALPACTCRHNSGASSDCAARAASPTSADPPAGVTGDDASREAAKRMSVRGPSLTHACVRCGGLPPGEASEREIAEMVRILKSACDRDWSDETPMQVANIAANAIYWRDREIERLKSAAAGKTPKDEACAPTCRAYGNYQPPYEDCTCGAEARNEARKAASPTLSEPEPSDEDVNAAIDRLAEDALARHRGTSGHAWGKQAEVRRLADLLKRAVSPAAQPEEQYGSKEPQGDVQPVREAVPLETVRDRPHDNQGVASGQGQTQAQEVTPLPVRQRIEQAADDAFEAVMKRMHPDVHYDSCERAAEFAAAREALIILRDDHVERLKAAAELCVTQAVNDGRRYHWRGYAEAMEDMKLVIKDLLSSLTDQTR